MFGVGEISLLFVLFCFVLGCLGGGVFVFVSCCFLFCFVLFCLFLLFFCFVLFCGGFFFGGGGRELGAGCCCFLFCRHRFTTVRLSCWFTKVAEQAFNSFLTVNGKSGLGGKLFSKNVANVNVILSFQNRCTSL